MKSETQLHGRIDAWVEAHREMIVGLLAGLVRQPSENRPPTGDEGPAQEFLRDWCLAAGFEPQLYDIAGVPGLDAHPLRNPRVDCSGRPNLAVRLPGARPEAGRSLLLSGHVDVVPAMDPRTWRHDPWGGEIEGNRLYGRGAYDMKGGLAANFAVLKMLQDLRVRLAGDLLVESVADEEFAGGHGTIAARLAGFNADAVLLPEPTNLAVYRAHRGLRIARLAVHGTGGVTFAGDRPEPAVHRLPELINAVLEFGAARNRALRPSPCYAASETPANWMITKVHANEWSDTARLAVPESAEIEVFWETLPGETQVEFEASLDAWLEKLRATSGMHLSHEYFLRWMSGYELAADHPLVSLAEKHAAAVSGRPATAAGAPFPCDLFLFRELGVPAGIILGPAGNNAHAADEWVDIESVLQVVRIYGRLACDWCGVAA